MNKTEKIENVSSSRVGSYYLVPAVRMLYNFHGIPIKGKLMPVHGPLHNDSLLDFPLMHYHVDWRFVEERILLRFLSLHPKKKFEMPWQWVLTDDTILGGPREHWFKMLRHFGNYPERPSWGMLLEEKYKNAVMEDGICPHRGLPCSSIKPNKQGVVVCPGHGLGWYAQTGRLASRVFAPPLNLENR